MTGAKLSQASIKVLEERGYIVTNVIAAGKAGVSDLIACIHGRYTALEVKGEGDTLKPLQADKLNKTIKAGGIGVVVRSLADVHEAIRLAETGMPCSLVSAELTEVTL